MDPALTVTALARLLDWTDEDARRLLDRVGGAQRLTTLPAGALVVRAGLSVALARRVRAALELATAALAAVPTPALRRPGDVARQMASLALSPREELWVIPVDSGLRPLGRHMAARGGRASCTLDAVDVLRPAVLDGGVGLFVVHNHPSGDPTPSDTDARFTRRLEEQARLLGLVVHDHLVLAGDRWASCVSGRRGRHDPARATGGPSGGWSRGAPSLRSPARGSRAATASRTP